MKHIEIDDYNAWLKGKKKVSKQQEIFYWIFTGMRLQAKYQK